MWGATPKWGSFSLGQEFQSTHPVWGATKIIPEFKLLLKFQSTHPVWGATRNSWRPFSSISIFQSTHPVWGATQYLVVIVFPPNNFNPRTPCGVRPLSPGRSWAARRISIHAPRVGCDARGPESRRGGCDFNPRTPCGVRHGRKWIEDKPIEISIHAPRVGCDCRQGWDGAPAALYFNPRTPCGVRRSGLPSGMRWLVFQSTHPVWGATPYHRTRTTAGGISIHAPRVGCDQNHVFVESGAESHFNPRTPCGVRQYLTGGYHGRIQFQSTHPVWGATANLYKVRGESLCSLHRLHSINSKCYNCGGEKISTPHINWKNVCANLPGML